MNNKACMALTYTSDYLPEYGDDLIITYINDTGEFDKEKAMKI